MPFATYKNTYSKNQKLIKTKIGILTNEGMRYVDALWDTGATSSLISQDLIDSFDFKKSEPIVTTSHRGKSCVDTYIVTLELPTGGKINNLRVLSGVYDELDFKIVIGLDIIKHCDFHMDYLGEYPVLTLRHEYDGNDDYCVETKLF